MSQSISEPINQENYDHNIPKPYPLTIRVIINENINEFYEQTTPLMVQCRAYENNIFISRKMWVEFGHENINA